MQYTYKHPHPAVTVDIVIFRVKEDALEVMLIKRAADPFKDAWALPGGFVDLNESLDEAARRELKEETGLSGISLEQLYAFGRPDRDPRERVITVAYYAVVRSKRLDIRAASDAADVDWFSVDNMPETAFDHGDILKMARARIPKFPVN